MVGLFGSNPSTIQSNSVDEAAAERLDSPLDSAQGSVSSGRPHTLFTQQSDLSIAGPLENFGEDTGALQDVVASGSRNFLAACGKHGYHDDEELSR